MQLIFQAFYATYSKCEILFPDKERLPARLDKCEHCTLPEFSVNVLFLYPVAINIPDLWHAREQIFDSRLLCAADFFE
jgi:hypothetical protein